jgi:two-component sensor histidine kinase/prenyltransferase beta subunit
MTWHEPQNYVTKYILGVALIFLLSGGVLQVFAFNHDSDVQTIQSEYESALEEYDRMNIYYTPEDIVQYVRIRQNPSGYFVLNPDLIFEPSELDPETLQATRFAVVTLDTLNHTYVINRNATVHYVMGNYVNYSTPEGNYTGFQKYQGYSAGVRSTCDALMILEVLHSLNETTLDLNAVESFILYHQNPDGGFWDEDYPDDGKNSTLLCTSFALRALGRIYMYLGKEFNVTFKDTIAGFVNSCVDVTDGGYANRSGGESIDTYATFRAFISLWWIGGSNDTERKAFVEQKMDLGTSVEYLFSNYYDSANGAFTLYEDDGFNEVSLKSTHLIVWFLVDMGLGNMLNVTALGHYLMNNEIVPGQYGVDIYSTYAAVLAFTRLAVPIEPLSIPEEPTYPMLGYPTFIPLLMMFLGITALVTYYFTEHKVTELEKTEHERLEKLVDERTKHLKMEIIEHKNTQAALTESESRYHRLFEDSALSLWIEDYSRVKEVMNNLQSSGVKDLRGFFEDNQNELVHCAELVEILDVNRATLSLHGLSDKKEMLGPLSNFLRRDSLPVFLDQIMALHSGNLPFESEVEELAVSGEKRALIIQLVLPPGYEETWSRVFLTIIDVTERKREKDRIAASLAEKELLLKEIHHRVKNNLQIISSLLYLQSNRISDNEVVMALRESEQRIRSMALIHEALYKSDDLARIDFEKYINDLAGYLVSSFGVSTDRVILKVDIKEKLLGIDVAIPCGLIVNELVSNSLKHAFRDDRSGEIEVCLKAIDDEVLELSVSDDGIGLPHDFNLSQNDTLGLRLVSSLAEKQLHGTFKLDDSEKTRFVIQFKKERGVK